MTINSVINQLDVLSSIANDLKTYLTTVRDARTFTGIEGNVNGADVLHDSHTYYGVSEFIIDDITHAKSLLANAKSVVIQTLD